MDYLKQNIALHWKAIDYIERKLPSKNIIKCLICEKIIDLRDLEKFESHCIFGGGYLKRHQCNNCGVIFGPQKMMDMTEDQLSDEYNIHYSVYEEGDSTEAEIRTFHLLDPTHEGVYLNYGCGNSSKTLQILNDEGWNVFGFDPSERDICNIGNKKVSQEYLKNNKFDGIFSNNVLEHFYNPIKELKFIKNCLKNEGRMSHTTPCFEYLYPYTRFHLFFYVAGSYRFLFKRSGLTIISNTKDGEFINYVLG